MGLLVTDLQYEYTHSVVIVLNQASEADFRTINESFDDLIAQASAQLEADGVPAADRHFRKIAECRYVGQGFELRADMPAGPLGPDTVDQVIDSFFDQHRQVYGHAFRDQLTEMITLRLVATADVDSLRLPDLAEGGRANPGDALMYVRDTVFDDGRDGRNAAI